MVNSYFLLHIIEPFTAHLPLALRLPVSSGLIVASLTTRDPGTRHMACDILRDLISLSIVTTSTWALITIMFR